LTNETNITLIVPKGVTVTILEAQEVDGDSLSVHPQVPASDEEIRRYWREYLTDNGKKIFTAAALIERHEGPGFTLDQIAQSRSIDYDSAKAWHRNTGRTAKRWREETGRPEPLRLEDLGEYGWRPEYSGNRTSYRLPPGAFEIVLELQAGG
jgi:hypothetical protein